MARGCKETLVPQLWGRQCNIICAQEARQHPSADTQPPFPTGSTMPVMLDGRSHPSGSVPLKPQRPRFRNLSDSGSTQSGLRVPPKGVPGA